MPIQDRRAQHETGGPSVCGCDAEKKKARWPTNSRNRCYDLPNLKAVQNRCFSSSVQAENEDPDLVRAPELCEERREVATHIDSKPLFVLYVKLGNVFQGTSYLPETFNSL